MGWAIVLWIHILAATIFVGPQVFLFAVAMPAIRTIDDVRQRASLTRMITRGFGALAGGALAVLIVTGIFNVVHANDNHDLDAKRYFITLQIKVTLVVIVLALTAIHGAVFGRRLEQMRDNGASEDEMANARRLSMYVSAANLTLSIIIVLCAAILGSDWSTMGSLR